MTAKLELQEEKLMPATSAEMKLAIMYGTLISRHQGISVYLFRGRRFVISDHDLSSET